MLPGWTKYTFEANGELRATAVERPAEHQLVFDVEVCVKDNPAVPVLAVAASPRAWCVNNCLCIYNNLCVCAGTDGAAKLFVQQTRIPATMRRRRDHNGHVAMR